MTGTGVLALAVVVEVAILTIGALSWVVTARRLRRALPASGIVTRSLVERDMSGGTESSSSVLRVTVRYVDGAGIEQVGTWSGQPNLLSSGLPVNSRVDLRYDPLRPGWITIEGREHPLLVIGLLTAAFMVAVAVAAVVIRSVVL